MPIPVQCRCGKAMSVPDEWAGREGRCPACKAILTVPIAAPMSPVQPIEVRSAPAAAAVATPLGAPPASAASAPAGSTPAAIFQNTLNALRVLVNPSSMPALYTGMGADMAMKVGIALGVLFDLCFVLAMYRLGSAVGMHMGDAAQWIKIFAVGLIPPAAMTVAILAVRSILRGTGSIASDLFIAGTSALPAACFLVVASVLGAGNMEVIGVVAVFAACYTVLLPYVGCTRILTFAESAAPACVAVILLAAAWVSKILIVKIVLG